MIDNFGLVFIVCSPRGATYLMGGINQDICTKKTKLIKLTEPRDNLYGLIDKLAQEEQFQILFIQGIENSFIDYIKPGYDGESYFYRKDSVPRVLGHLNLQRERFRDNFNFCIVFLVRSFGLNYFIHRAPDFFDWRSGVFDFEPAIKQISIDINEKDYAYRELDEQLKYIIDESLAETINQSIISYVAYQEIKDAKFK
jgi:superkiller protein 3